MNYKIYIKKQLLDNEYPGFYLGFTMRDKMFFLHMNDNYIDVLTDDVNTVKDNYYELEEFIGMSEYVGLKDNISRSTLLYKLNGICLIKYHGEFSLDYNENYELNNRQEYNIYKYEHIFNNIINDFIDIISQTFPYFINDIIKLFGEQDYISELLNKLELVDYIDDKIYYEKLLFLPKIYNKRVLKSYFYKYVKSITQNIQNIKLRDKMIDEALDAYNYLKNNVSKKLSKKM